MVSLRIVKIFVFFHIVGNEDVVIAVLKIYVTLRGAKA